MIYSKSIEKSGNSLETDGSGSYMGVSISASLAANKESQEENSNEEVSSKYFESRFRYNF